MSNLNRLGAVMDQYREGIINKKELIRFVGDMNPAEIVEDIINTQAKVHKSAVAARLERAHLEYMVNRLLTNKPK